MKMIEARGRGYIVFDNCDSPAHSKQFEDSLRYIDDMANRIGISVDEWDVLSIFKNPNSEKGFVHVDKNKLNQAFFNHMAVLKHGTTEKPIVRLTAVQMESLRYVSQNASRSHRRRHQRKYDENISGAQEHMRAHTTCLIEARKSLKEMQSYRNTNDYMTKIVEQILASEWWMILDRGVQSEYLEFISPNINLKYKNPAQAVDIDIDMGRYLARLFVEENPQIRVYPLDTEYGKSTSGEIRNIILDDGGHWHPHVNTEGGVCFGNLLHEYTVAQANYDYVKIMDYTKAILSDYCNENPYAHLHEFRDELQEIKRREEENGEEESEDETTETVTRHDFDEALREAAAAVRGSTGQSGGLSIRPGELVYRNDITGPIGETTNYTIGFAGGGGGGNSARINIPQPRMPSFRVPTTGVYRVAYQINTIDGYETREETIEARSEEEAQRITQERHGVATRVIGNLTSDTHPF